MTIRASEASKPDDGSSETTSSLLSNTGETKLQISGDKQLGRKSGYSILLRGDVTASSILSSSDPNRSVTELENDTKLLAGSVRGGTAGFVLHGTILAAEFDDPVPTVKLDGSVVDPDQWPTVREVTGYGSEGSELSDPFTPFDNVTKQSTEPTSSVVTLDATDLTEPAAYCLDVDGEVLERPESATVADAGDRVFGYLNPGASESIEVAGDVTRVDAGDGVEFSIRRAENR